MAQIVQAIRGMHDVLPQDIPHWRHLEEAFRQVVQAYGYEEIRFPVVEKTELFVRTIGEVTDIVEKEMYTFEDLNGERLSLRPEGTAGCVRACLENGLLHNQVQRLWYGGPMFRHERPQKGRYRQFHQLGVEAYGMPGPDIDAELVFIGARLWRALGIPAPALQLNSLGTPAARARYRERLVVYLESRLDELDEDSRRRLHRNPLRVLDSKNPSMRAVIEEAPSLLDHLDAESAEHFAQLRALLDEAGIAYTVNPRLVRGLDYYEKTVFEWVSDRLGAQGTVCAGGRYDGLVEHLGGRPTPAAGFALGMERLLALMQEAGVTVAGQGPQAYLVMAGAGVTGPGLRLAEALRDRLPQLRLRVHCGGGSFKSQMKKADRSGAALALILGEEELADASVSVKFLREQRPQMRIDQDALADFLEGWLREEGQSGGRSGGWCDAGGDEPGDASGGVMISET